ncbi:MAG: hypothetical protein JXM70_13650 [Pirellulales bacterium]|nr:hypothetical protein [Pirellulales bacterium]
MRDLLQNRLQGNAVLTILAIAIELLAIGFTCVNTAWGADFRVENKVFLGSDKKPLSESTTIFKDGIVYDYLVETGEVTVFDIERERFFLLDTRLKLKTQLSSKLVKAATDSLKSRADLSSDPFASFLINPRFDCQVDDERGELLFSSTMLEYRVVAVPAKTEEIANDYWRFADWFARLKTYIRPGARPPFARMLVNEELGRRGELPREVHLTLKPKQGLASRKIRMHSEHKIVTLLGDVDSRRVAETAEHLAVFEPISFKEYEQKQAKFETERGN